SLAEPVAAAEPVAPKIAPPEVGTISLAADGAPPVGDRGLFAPPPLLVRVKGWTRDTAKVVAAFVVAKSKDLYERARELQRVNPKAAIVGGVLGAAVLLLIVGGFVAMCSKPKHSSTDE